MGENGRKVWKGGGLHFSLPTSVLFGLFYKQL